MDIKGGPVYKIKIVGINKLQVLKSISLIIVVVCSCVLFIISFVDRFFPNLFLFNVSILINFIIIIFIFFVSLFIILQINISLRKIDLEEAEKKMKSDSMLKKAKISEKSGFYFEELVKINLDNLSSYYSLVKKSAEKSFYVSIFSGVLGFSLLIFSIVFGLIYNKNDILTYISVGAGIITEFISGTFFYLYNKTVRQMKEYHDSLVVVQNILLSFKLVQDTKNDEQKIKLTELIIQYLTETNKKIKN